MTSTTTQIEDFTTIRDALIAELELSPEEYRAIHRRERDKRIRTEGLSQYASAESLSKDYDQDPYMPVIDREPLTDHVEAMIIGGGFGGLSAGAQLRQQGCEDIRIIDEAGDFGGAWYWNRYPGAMCDIESLVYLPLLEETGFIPTQKYSLGPEIREHAQGIGRHFRLYDKAAFHTAVTAVHWDESNNVWVVETNREDRMTCDYLIIASGPLSRPKYPRIPGIETFPGKVFHTSRWDYDYTGGDEYGSMMKLADKRVGIVGTGATSLQAVPKLAESAGEFYVIQRTPSTVDVRANRKIDAEIEDALPPGWQEKRKLNFLTIVSGGKAEEDHVADGWTALFNRLTGNAVRPIAERLGRRLTVEEKKELLELLDFKKMDEIRARIDETVDDPQTAASLKPWYRLLCKRPGFHDEYLDSFNRENTHLVDTHGKGVTEIRGNTVIAGDHELELDCLIFATGFEVGTQYTTRNGYDVIGRDGMRLSEKWHDGFRTFHGLHSVGFPNCFFMGRIQTGTSVNYTHTVGEQAKHIAYIYREQKERNLPPLEATPEAEQDWVDTIVSSSKYDEEFYAECTPGYFNNEGKKGNSNNFFSGSYGGGPVKFFGLLEEWRAEGTLRGLEPIK